MLNKVVSDRKILVAKCNTLATELATELILC